MVALDLDGTLLNSSHKLSSESISTLQKIANIGVIVCIATGRSTASIHSYVKELELPTSLPCISFNGASSVRLSHLDNIPPEVIFMDPLSDDNCRDLVAFAKKQGYVAQYYNGLTSEIQAVPTTEEHKYLMRKYAALVGTPQTQIASYDDAFAKSPSAKMLLLTKDPDALLEIVDRELGRDRFHMIRGSPDPFFVEFLTPGVCKGTGLKKMCEAIGMPLEHVAAFGDGDNDVEMLELAGLGVAMANARDVTKAAADVVLQKTNDDNGVACFIDELLAAGKFDVKS